jgi:hypothetical protein
MFPHAAIHHSRRVPFALGLTLGEGGTAAEPDVVDPSPGLGDGGEQSCRLNLGFQYWWTKLEA